MSWPNRTFPPAETSGFCQYFRNESTRWAEQHINVETALNQDNEMVNNPGVESSSSHTKKRKLKSKVWDEFTKTEEDGKEWAICNHCKKRFGGSSKSGTTHLKNHLERCPTKRSNTAGSGAADKSADKTANVIARKSKIDVELNQADKTRMIIKYWVPSLASIKDDILNVFKEEKQKLKGFLHKLPCRLNLSVEYCNLDCDLHCDCLLVLSSHFIDDNWELKKKFIYFDIGDDDSSEKLKRMVEDWKMEKHICSVVVDCYFDDCGGCDGMSDWLSERGSPVSAGTFLALPRLVVLLRSTYWWGPQSYIIKQKMKKLKEYVSSNGNNFEKAIDKAAAANSMLINLISHTLPPTDDKEFKLVEWGVGLKEAFWELEHIDPVGFKPLNLTKEEWDHAIALYEFGKDVRDIASSLSHNYKYTTPNVYFPKICHLYMKFLQWQKTDMGSFWEEVSTVRNDYFDSYWGNLNLILAITVVLDPRFKMDIVKLWSMEIYGDASIIHIKKIIDAVNNIYNEYANATESSKTSPMLDQMGRPCKSLYQVDYIGSSTQSELDRYLKDSKIPAVEDFDILAWWRSNAPIYPTLARMARDYLAIPIGVEDDLDPSLKDEILNIQYCEDLDDDIKEALIHTKVWLYTPGA